MTFAALARLCGMAFAPVVVSLPISDRRASFDFYSAVLGVEAVGELASDGLPEPLQFAINDGLRLMLVPRGGFGWVIGAHEVAPNGASECVLSVSTEDVDALMARAADAGATIVTAAARQPWGYTGTFADPDGHLWMATLVDGARVG